MNEDDSIGLDDYPYELPQGWEGIDIDSEHLIYENQGEERAIELMLYDGGWQLSTSNPNPMRGGMMDLIDSWSYEDVDEAYDKINEILNSEVDYF